MASDLNTFLSRLLYSRLPHIGGGGGSTSGMLTLSTTSAGTIADTNETDLWTYTMPANMLGANGRAVRIRAAYTTAANGNTKTGKLYFGGTAINSRAGADNALNVSIDALVIRTGASAQIYHTQAWIQTSIGTHALSTLAVDTTGTIVIKFTGQNGTAAANDLVFQFATVELLN